MFGLKKAPKEEQSSSSVDTTNNLAWLYADIGWLRQGSRRMMQVIFWQAIVILVLIGVIFFLTLTREKPVYFAATPDLRVIELAPLSQPVLTDDRIIQWVNYSVVQSLSLDFAHWKEQLGNVRKLYFPKSFDAFVIALKESGILEKIVKEKLVVTAVTDTSPIITNKGEIAGKYTWKLSFPIKLSFEGGTGVLNTQTLDVTILVQRADTRIYPQGVAIKQVVIK